jgi:MinD-like ATPase involved in chromosome partitioning or flagellar assembly
MVKIVSVHSFRCGTGKTNTTANLSALLAKQGFRVAVIDTDIQSPGLHALFNLKEEDLKNTLNDYLWGKCEIQDAAHDMTAQLGADITGQIFLIPSSIKTDEIIRIMRDGYDAGLLNEGFRALIRDLELDYLIIDTHPGLNEETLLSVAHSDTLIVVLRPDQLDFQGTAVIVDVARKLDVAELMFVVNKVPNTPEFENISKTVEETYNGTVAAVLHHSDEMMTLASAGIFSLHYPEHEITKELEGVVERLK